MRGHTSPDTRTADIPSWVRVFTDFGRPLMSVVVLVLCAPGEQHLAQLAGWAPWLSWGMASLLAAYAGIAAVVATVLPQSAPGRGSAVAGAVVALLLAMAAQPVAHLFVTGWLSATPRAPIWLVVTVSGVPPLILGHLLHLARVRVRTDSQAVPADSHTDTDTVSVVPAYTAPVPVSAPVPSVSVPVVPVSVPVSLAKRPARTGNVRQIGQGTGLAAYVRELADKGMSETDIADEVKRTRPDTKADTLGKTIRREFRARTA